MHRLSKRDLCIGNCCAGLRVQNIEENATDLRKTACCREGVTGGIVPAYRLRTVDCHNSICAVDRVFRWCQSQRHCILPAKLKGFVCGPLHRGDRVVKIVHCCRGIRHSIAGRHIQVGHFHTIHPAGFNCHCKADREGIVPQLYGVHACRKRRCLIHAAGVICQFIPCAVQAHDLQLHTGKIQMLPCRIHRLAGKGDKYEFGDLIVKKLRQGDQLRVCIIRVSLHGPDSGKIEVCIGFLQLHLRVRPGITRLLGISAGLAHVVQVKARRYRPGITAGKRTGIWVYHVGTGCRSRPSHSRVVAPDCGITGALVTDDAAGISGGPGYNHRDTAACSAGSAAGAVVCVMGNAFYRACVIAILNR